MESPNVSVHAALRGNVQTFFERIENVFDAFFGGTDNPLRHLGALGLYFLWLLVASGLYLYTVLDASVAGVYRSIGYLSQQQWYLGGILRSLHRYAADAFVLVMALHLLREWAYGRYYGFRLYSWVTGVPLIWLAYISGIGGYWIVWDPWRSSRPSPPRNCSTGCPSSPKRRRATFSRPTRSTTACSRSSCSSTSASR